jgi:glycosyltransferase involved in cell wall biosynthesis
VLAQGHPPAEIIVIDDGSEDNTRKIVESYGKMVHYAYQENKGVSAARNRGVAEANTEWIAFLDSDDYWLPHHLSNIVSAIKATDGRASLYFSDTMPSQEKGGDSLWNFCRFPVAGPFLFKNDASAWAFMHVQPIMLQSSVIRKEAYWEVGGLPEKMLTREDTFLFYKLALHYPACAVSGCGTIMTSEGTQRLTHLYDGYNLVFLQSTILLYKLLLAGEKRIRKRYRKVLKNSLSNSYFGLGRYYQRRNDFIMALLNLLAAAWIGPGSFARRLLDKLVYRAPNSDRAAESNTGDMSTQGRRE